MVSSEIKNKAINRMLRYRDNIKCIDCGIENTEYVNVTFGALVCHKCFLIHLAQGFNENLKQIGDDFEYDELVMVSTGGNTALFTFWEVYDLNYKPISYKYATVASDYYRNMLESLSKYNEYSAPLPMKVLGRDLSEIRFRALTEKIEEVPVWFKRKEENSLGIPGRVKLFFSNIFSFS